MNVGSITRKTNWIVGTLVTLCVSGPVSAQVPDMFGQAAKTIDQVRLQQSVGILAMVIFSMVTATALALRKLTIGFTALFLVFASYAWYSDIGRGMITTTGTAIAP